MCNNLKFLMKNNIAESVEHIMTSYEMTDCLKHTRHVVEIITDLAKQFEMNEEQGVLAAWLHDISGVMSRKDQMDYCKAHNIEVIKEEEMLPLLVHQKVSKHMAENQFGIKDDEILSAIACHTTLKPNGTTLDKMLFIADKIGWDKEGEPPYKKLVLEGLEISLDEGIYQFMKYTIDHNMIQLMHPDYQATFNILKANRG